MATNIDFLQFPTSFDHKLTGDVYYTVLQFIRTKDMGDQRFIYFPPGAQQISG